MMQQYAGESSGSSSGESSRRNDGISKGETPLFLGLSSLETAELHHAPEGLVQTNVGDYSAINGIEDFKNVFSVESIKLWAIAGPIAFNILCNYAVNSFTNIFVGHLGDVELSAVAISLSVISNFSFGFLVSSIELLSSFPMLLSINMDYSCLALFHDFLNGMKCLPF